MNRRGLLNLLGLCCVGLVLAGCASTPRSDLTESAGPIRDPNKPSLFFSGGTLSQVRGVAMGAAVTQGWEVLDTPASADSLILQRNLDSRMADNLAPGSSLGPLTPLVQVQTDFFPRAGGIDVQLGAQVVTGRGTDKELRQDFTESYRNELTHSLTMLQTAWHESGPRVVNALPPIGGLRDTSPVPWR